MTTEIAKDASSIRIRNNQRRSRARRKEYIHDLEQRLSRFERLGVEVNREIQAAGRKVVKENALLRSLLGSHGVTETEIEEYLRNSSVLGTSDCSTRMSPSLTLRLQPAQPTPPYKRTVKQHSEGRKDKSKASESMASLSRPSPDDIQPYHPSYSSDLDRGVSDLGPRAEEAQSEEHQPGGRLDRSQSTSCKAAAKIIASIRGYLDIQDVQVELGCSSTLDCMVKNTTIFEVLGSYL